MSDWFGAQQQWQRRQREMGAAWQQRKNRESQEQAEAQQRAREAAAERARAQQRDQRVREATGWRPPSGGDVPDVPDVPPATVGAETSAMPRSQGFVRELPRRLLRIALTALFFVFFYLGVVAFENGEGGFALVALAVVVAAAFAVDRLEPGRRGPIEGIATHVVSLPGSGATPSRLTFRVERYDSRGGRMTPVPVEMTGGDIKGQLLDGDEVRLERGRVRRGALHPRRVVNLRTRETVKLGRRASYWIGVTISWVAFLAVLGFVVAIIIGSG